MFLLAQLPTSASGFGARGAGRVRAERGAGRAQRGGRGCRGQPDPPPGQPEPAPLGVGARGRTLHLGTRREQGPQAGHGAAARAGGWSGGRRGR